MDTSVRAALRVAGLALFLLACEPTFEHEGTVTAGAGTFRPTMCHVLTSATGIELVSAEGSRLVLTIPPQRLEAFHDIEGTAHARYEPAGATAVDLGDCGTLHLRGEGYHGKSRRAASGKASLACALASGPFTGVVSFRGCF